MKLVIFNGSPRFKKSNSRIIIDHFLAGYRRIGSDPVSICYLADKKRKKDQEEIFLKANNVIIVFPLYTDAMPALVKEFFERIAGLAITGSKRIGFIVQSGFPESIHSIYVERYLEKFTRRLQCEYLGTVIKGGVEGIQIMPGWMTKKLFDRFEQLGAHFAEHKEFSSEIKAKLKKPLKFSPVRRFVFGIINKTGLTNFYWDSNLKKNDAFKNRFDKPFEDNQKFPKEIP